MKRYLVFYGNVYYPSGGAFDLLCDVDTFDEGKNKVDERLIKDFREDGYETLEEHIDYRKSYDWAHIYDTETDEITDLF